MGAYLALSYLPFLCVLVNRIYTGCFGLFTAKYSVCMKLYFCLFLFIMRSNIVRKSFRMDRPNNYSTPGIRYVWLLIVEIC